MPQFARGAAFAGDRLVLIATAGAGACAPDPLALPQPSRLIQFDLATGETAEIAAVSGRLLDVLWASAVTREVVVLPRGCDVGIGELRVYNADGGELLRTAAVDGAVLRWARLG